MMLGVVAVAFSSASGEEQARWKEAARREGRRYGVARDYVEARMEMWEPLREVVRNIDVTR